MSAIKISKDNIIKDTIKINRKDLHTDSAFVFGKRKENEDALYEIQAYNAKLSNNEYLSSEDLKAYDNAINKYESSGNTLRRLSALNGYTYSDEENKSWEDIVSSLRQGHKAATDIFSNFKDENEYKTYAKWMTVDVAKELGNYSLAVQYENRLADLNSEYNKLSNTKTRGKSVYDPITKTTTYREYDNSSRMDEIEREISYCESMIETLTGGRGTADLKLYLDEASTYQASRPESGLVEKYLSFDVAQGNANLLEARTLQSRLTYQLYENEAEAEEYRARIDELTDGMGVAGYEMFLSQATELQENEEFMSLDISAEREKLNTFIGKRDSITNLDNQLLQENQILSSMLSQYGSLVNPDTGEPWKGLENNEEAINASKLIKDKKNKIRSIEALIYTETNGKARNLEEFEQYIHEHKGYLTNVENTRTFIKLSEVVNNSDFEEYAQKGEGMDTSELDVYIKRPFSHHTAAKEKCRKRDNMEAKELKIYYYYIGRGDKEKAEDYLELLEPTLTERAKKSYIEDTDNVVEALMLKAQGALDGASQSLLGVWNFITGDDAYIPPTAAQMAASSEEVDQILGDVDLKWYNFREGEWKDQDIFGRSLGQVTGDFVHTTVYQLPSTLLSFIPGAGPVLSRAYTGISAAGNAYNEMIGLGYRANQARLYGLLVGASEAGLSALLDGTMHGSGKLTGFTKKKILSSINNVYARVAIDTVFNEIGEFTEESLQAFLEPWFKSIATNTDFEAPTLEDTLYSGLLGALSANMLGNIDVTSDSTVAGAIYTTIKGNQVKKIDGGVSRLAKLGRTFSADTVAYQIANKVNDKTGAYTIGRLLNEANATLTAQNKSEIAKSLERKGFIGEHADAVVNALAAVVEGAKLSPNAIMALDGNPIIARTIRDVIINPNSTVNQRTKGLYDLARGKSATVATDTANTVTGEAKTVETSEGATAQESATQGKYEVSTDGKTMLMSTSEYVNPVRVESIENGSVRVKLDNGETVDASELAFATLDEAILYEMVARMGDVTPETATALIKNFKATDGVSAQTYALDIPLAYQYGKINYKDGLENLDLTIDQRQVAFQHGRNAAEAEAEAEQEAINERINSGKATNEKSTKRKGSVRFENGVTAKTRVQKRAVALAKHLARALGIDIVFYDDITTTDENGKRANGYFDEETDTIHLDLQNSKNDAKTIVFTMAHELTHFIKKWSPVKFKVFADFLMEHYGNTGVTLEAKMEQLGTTDRKLAYEEMICDACETMLLDSNAVVKLMQLRATDLDLFGKIKLHVLELLNKIRTEYKKLGLEPTSDEAKALLKMEGVLEKLSTMFEEAALDAAQNYQATEGVKTEGIKKQAKKQDISEKRYVGETPKIQKGMTEEERYEILKNRSISNIPPSTKLSSNVLEKTPEISSWDDINKYLGKDKRKLIQKITTEFGVFDKEFFNKDIELSFKFSGNNFRESYNKQGHNYTEFAKMFSVFDTVIESAVGIEIHNRPDYKPDPTLENVFVLISAYQDGDFIVPVKLEVKQFTDKQNTLYVAISLEKIKKTEVLKQGNTETGVTQNSRSVDISIAQLFSKINPSDKNFLKYIPDGFLNASQKNAKKFEGIKKQAKKPISIPGTDITLSQSFVDNTLSSFGMEKLGDFEQAQESVYNTLLNEGFFTDTNPVSRKDTNDESGMVVETNKSGLDETFCRENYGVLGRFKKIVKLATIRELPKAIKYGRLLDDDVPNKYDKTKGTKYAYLLYDTYLDGVDVTIKIAIRKSAQKNKFWVHGLETIENVSDPPADTTDGIKTGSTTADIGGIITQPKPIVKKQMKKSSDSYSYESLISKPDMKVTTLSGTVPSNRADVVVQAKKNAAAIGRTDKYGGVYVRVDDIDTEVLLGRDGLKHSIDRRLDVNAPVVVKAGEIISNSILINELTPQKPDAETSYVLIGTAKNANGDLYIVRSVINRFSGELTSIDVLYAINAKKELAALNAPLFTGNPALGTNSNISIAQLLEIVNREFPDVLPESVLRHFGHEFRPEGKLGKSALFQKKRQSNREILADTLTSSIDTSTQEGQNELRKLKEYKEKISLIEKEEAHLAEIKAEIAKIFNKGTDRSKLSSLNDEKIKTANRIDHYDKLLMRLEAMKPIKNILEREKAAARKKAELKNKEALKAAREKAEEKQRKLVVRYQESRAKAVERRRETEYRNKIKDHKGKLESLLLHPTDKKYVPIGLVNAVIEVCELINTDTDLYKKDGSINKSQEERNLTKEKLRKLKDEYEKLGKHKDPTYKEEFDQAIYDYLTKLQENFADKNINDMTLDELRELYETIRNIEETLRDARKLIGWEDSRDVYETGDAIISEQTEIRNKRKKGKRNLGQKLNDKTLNYTLSPMRNVERMTDYNEDSPLFKLFKKLEQGVRKKNRFVQSCFKLFEHLTTGKKNAKLYEDAVYNKFGEKWVDDNGKTFYISKMQAMQVVLSYEREQANNLNHIALGGFTFADLKYLLKGDLKNALDTENEHRVSSSNAVNMVESLRESLKYDKWAQDYMEVARKFFNENAKDAINETTLAIKHRAIATENSYIPFEVDKSFLYREITDLNDVQQAISSYGMLKQIEPGSAEPITITGLNNIIDRHINQVGTIYGLAIEIRNFNKIWNVTKRAADGKPISAVREAIGGTWGNEGAQHIEQAVMDVQGKRTDKRSAIYKKARRNIFFVTFFLNAASTLKQVGSMFSACSMIRPRGKIRMLANLVYTMARHKKIAAEVDKYTATAWMRRQGLSDGELQTLFTEGKKTLVGKANSKFPTALNPAKWQQGMDYAVALSLWKYAKQDTAKKTGLKGEALLEATAQFYDDVVENTQSMADVLHRPEVQKANNFESDVLGTFKTDLYQMAGQLYVSAGRFAANKSKENAKALGRTAYAAVSAAVWTQLMTTVFNLLRYRVDDYRDDDDGEVKAELILKRMAFLFAADIAGYIFPLLGSEAVGIFENIKYGKSTGVGNNIVLDAVEDCCNAYITVASKAGDGVSIDGLTKLVTKSLQLFGVPANNILRTIKAIRLHAIDIANGEFLSFEAGLERTATQHAHRIIEAIASGKTDIAAGLYEEAVEELTLRKANDKEVDEDDEEKLKEIEKDVISSLKTALGNKYKDGEIDRDTASKTLSEAFDMSDIDIYWKLDEWDYVIENGSDDGYSKYNDIIEAVKSGNAESAIEEFVEREVDGLCKKAKAEAENEGKKFDEKKKRKEIEKDVKSSVKSSITKYWKAFVINAYLKDDTDKLDMLLDLLYNTGLYGTKKETRRTMKKWAEED